MATYRVIVALPNGKRHEDTTEIPSKARAEERAALLRRQGFTALVEKE